MVVGLAAPATEESMWAQVAAAGWDPSATAAVMGLDRSLTGAGGTAAPVPAAPDRERWDVDAPAGGFLRVGSRWDPGWSATVDGRPARVLRADGVFRGVAVPPGRHTVAFSYRNPEEMRGRVVAVVALVVLMGLVVTGRKTRAGVNPGGHESV